MSEDEFFAQYHLQWGRDLVIAEMPSPDVT